jgi:hypothetical protein
MKVLTANGTIPTSVFVTMDSVGADNAVIVAVADAFPYGISGEGGKYAPLPNVTTTPPTHAEAGDPCKIHTPSGNDLQDSTVMLRIGASVTRGQRLMPTTAGVGIPATTGKYYGAIADESGSSGEVIRVTPLIGLQA